MPRNDLGADPRQRRETSRWDANHPAYCRERADEARRVANRGLSL